MEESQHEHIFVIIDISGSDWYEECECGASRFTPRELEKEESYL